MTPQQDAALVALRQAFANDEGSVREGWGVHLSTLRSLERLGLCVVTDHTPVRYVKRGRFLKGRGTWTAKITDAGLQEANA